MTKVRLGKTIVTVSAEGCIRCGTKWSTGWRTAKIVKVNIDGRLSELKLHTCHNCATAGEKERVAISGKDGGEIAIPGQ